MSSNNEECRVVIQEKTTFLQENQKKYEEHLGPM